MIIFIGLVCVDLYILTRCGFCYTLGFGWLRFCKVLAWLDCLLVFAEFVALCIFSVCQCFELDCLCGLGFKFLVFASLVF